jgi:hypothetical protein
MGTVQYPLINGVRMDFSSINFAPIGARIVGIKSINYEDELNPGIVRGTSAQVIGRTRGEYNATFDFEIYREDWLDLCIALSKLTTASGLSPSGTAPGIYEVSFPITVAYAETPASPVQTDTLLGSRLKKAAASNSSSSEALSLKVEGHALMLIRNNAITGSPIYPISVPLG